MEESVAIFIAFYIVTYLYQDVFKRNEYKKSESLIKQIQQEKIYLDKIISDKNITICNLEAKNELLEYKLEQITKNK